MFDFSKKILGFHDDVVTLKQADQASMRNKRDLNLERINRGLADNNKPKVVQTITQGGYAQRTMTNPPEKDEESRYDIDLGVVFEAEDEKGPQTCREWVRSALADKATGIKNLPEAKNKCVRIVYSDGYQCDFPVFRRTESWDGSYKFEIAAGSEWIDSDPQSINSWINQQVKDLSPKDSNQLRRIIRLGKFYCKTHAHRTRAKLPSGLVASALFIECYVSAEGRDDESFYKTLQRISYRSEYASVFADLKIISDSKDVDRIKRLIDQAKKSASDLECLLNDSDETKAYSAWKRVFSHTYFDSPSSSTVKKNLDGLRESATMRGATGLGIAPFGF